MANTPMRLYYDMSEKLSDHLRATRAYPVKFVLSRQQHKDYLRDVALLSDSRGKRMDPAHHMGVPVEISDGPRSFMVALDGAELPIL